MPELSVGFHAALVHKPKDVRFWDSCQIARPPCHLPQLSQAVLERAEAGVSIVWLTRQLKAGKGGVLVEATATRDGQDRCYHRGQETELALAAEITGTVPPKYCNLLERRDGAAQLVSELPKDFRPTDVATPTKEQHVWEMCGNYFRVQGRFHEALAIYRALYDHMLIYQEETGTYGHKGMPLVWMSECHAGLGHPVLAKRYLMLTICEDAIKCRGQMPSETGGVYFRAVWGYGLPHRELTRYAAAIWRLYQDHPTEALFPDWIMQELDQEWMTEYPSPQEATLYEFNGRYVRWLLERLGAGDGKALERLAHYLLASMPGCRAHMRKRSKSTDYDVICSLEGFGLDFRSEFGRYFLCECKDWSTPADFTAIAKFCRVLESAKCRFGIVFSKHGLTGAGRGTDAEREQLKLFQERGLVLVVISEPDLERLAAGANFITMLRAKYEQVRLDLRT